GVWFFDLAAVSDPAAVPDAVAAVLGIIQQPGKSVSESVAAALEGRFRLLVFDNCEHVRDAAADLIEAILAHSASVKILATSREGLGVAEEQLWPVPSLDVEAGVDSAAVALFVERARSVAPRFSLSNADEPDAVVEICRRLDGIPLAIELAASRMASMSPMEVRDRLDQRSRVGCLSCTRLRQASTPAYRQTPTTPGPASPAKPRTASASAKPKAGSRSSTPRTTPAPAKGRARSTGSYWPILRAAHWGPSPSTTSTGCTAAPSNWNSSSLSP